jgi:hypothetical protein
MERPRPSQARSQEADRRVVRLNVHGLAVEMSCALPGMRQMIGDLFGALFTQDLPEGFQPVEGSIEAYDADVVARNVSGNADRVAMLGDSAELWRDGERCWLLDDAWGLCEINLLKRSWRSWVLGQCDLDPIRAIEQAVLWPMSQVLMSRGLSLVPAASVVHRGRGVLLLSPFSLEPELTQLTAAGHGMIGQRWTGVREEEGRCILLRMPGRVERSPIPQLRSKSRAILSSTPTQTEWIDLATDAATNCNYAWCEAVFVVEPGRRAASRMTALNGASATAAVRRAWAMPDVSHLNRQAQLATRLGQTCGVFQVELSRDPRALLRLIEQLPADVAGRSKLQPSLHVASPTKRLAI